MSVTKEDLEALAALIAKVTIEHDHVGCTNPEVTCNCLRECRRVGKKLYPFIPWQASNGGRCVGFSVGDYSKDPRASENILK